MVMGGRYQGVFQPAPLGTWL